MGLFGLLVVAAPIYWGVLPIFLQSVDADPEFAGAPPSPDASQAVATSVALLERELERHGWVPNLPFFYPMSSVGADDMRHFQTGIVAALHRFALELSDQIGRVRGSSEVDADLDEAAGLLRYPPDIWYVDSSATALLTTPSHDQYRTAMRALRQYNERVAAGEATFDRRSDNLLAALDRIALDLGSLSATLGERVADRNWTPFDFGADDRFYDAKGRLYAYYLILRDLKVDFAEVIAARDLERPWAEMLISMGRGATLRPLMVMNGAPDGLAAPNHLSSLGFQLLRARTQLREITNILLK
ncbi:MAG: DUF2333 family protein [Pseudomonadota bacterium]